MNANQLTHIQTPNGLVAGFNRQHQIVVTTNSKDHARIFRSAAEAKAFIKKYADAGYSFVRATAQIVNR